MRFAHGSLKFDQTTSFDRLMQEEKIEHVAPRDADVQFMAQQGRVQTSVPRQILHLIRRGMFESFHDMAVYWVRAILYTGFAAVIGRYWLRMDSSLSSIQPFTNALFLVPAMMSVVAITYVPAFFEERKSFVRERALGMYGATSFVIANFVVGLPFLLLISVMFSVTLNIFSDLQPTTATVLTWFMWTFLDLLATESMIVFFVSLPSKATLTLGIVAFVSGLLSSFDGFLAFSRITQTFMYELLHSLNYQAYAFQQLIGTLEIQRRAFDCGAGCQSLSSSDLADEQKIAGTAVLEQYGYHAEGTGNWIGILLGITLTHRIFACLVNHWRRT